VDNNAPLRYRSLFWPILLIGIGGLWLLFNLDFIPRENWLNLWRLWPLLLIAVGLDFIFGRRFPLAGAVIGLGAVGLAVALLFTLPSLDLPGQPDVATDHYVEPIGTATSATVDLNLSIGPSTITSTSDPDTLFEAQITHIGEIEFLARGATEKTISLRERQLNIGTNWLDWFDKEQELHWDISLNRDIPLYLDITGGIGEATLDLRDLNLTGMRVETGVGDVNLNLPATDTSYPVDIKAGVGEIRIDLQQGAEVEFDVEGGVGDLTIALPDNAAVHIEAETGVGDIRVPSFIPQVSGQGDQFPGMSGVWETPGFSSADRQITITFVGGVGDLTIR
jgi:hypothetical protein